MIPDYSVFKIIKDVYLVLSSNQRSRFFCLQMLVILSAFLEVVSVALVPLYLKIVSGSASFSESGVYSFIHNQFSFKDSRSFVIVLGVLLVLYLAFSTFVSMYTLWKLAGFAARLGSEFSIRLFNYYLNVGWLFHATESSSQLSRKLSHETQRITGGVINPLLQMNARLFLGAGVLVFLFVYDWKITMTALAIYIVSYVIIFKTVRSRLHRNGTIVTEGLADRYRLMNDSFGGAREVVMHRKQRFFVSQFEVASYRLARGLGINIALVQSPRFLIEFVTFSSIVLFVLVLHLYPSGRAEELLAKLAVFAMAAFKILPSFQQVYASLASVKADAPAFYALKSDFVADRDKDSYEESESDIEFKDSIYLDNISFTYPGKSSKALDGVSLTIKANASIGFMGASGGGKSTLIDIIAGLLEPETGVIRVDGQSLNRLNITQWQKKIGLVSQSVFLTEGSLAENIAFGLPVDEIDFKRINHVLKSVGLFDYVSSLSENINSLVGENGVQLSGGQRQRIALARALYNDPDILIFDEATSALDGESQRVVLSAIKEMSGEKTIIMIAHRLDTIRDCDNIFIMSDGKVVDSGSFEYLESTSDIFKKLGGIQR